MRNKEYVPKCLAPRSCNDRVAIKIYVEQLLTKQERFDADGNVRELEEERKQEVLEAFKARLKSIPKNEWQIIAIVHDKDPARGGWSDATDKPHIHVIVRCVERDKSGDYKRPRVTTYLNRLGIYYQISDDNPVDKKLWEEHGVEYCCHFAENAIYLLHKSDKAKAQGKEPYEIEELFGNLTIDEIREVMKGYTQVGESLGKVTEKTLEELKQVAYDLGYSLGDFTEWYKSLPLQVLRSNNMRVYQEMYRLGMIDRASKRERIGRLCVFVGGATSLGKTHAAIYALDKLGVAYLPVNGGGTGKFDNLKPTHGGIVIDDDVCPNLLNMSDFYHCPAYRRGRNNPYWTGKYFIVTSNLSFDDWVESCGIKDERNKAAMRRRFYICHIVQADGINMLKCDSMESRNSPEMKKEVFAMYKAFRDLYNESLEQYQSFDYSEDDYSNVDGDLYAMRKAKEKEEAERAEEEKKKAAERTEEERKKAEKERKKYYLTEEYKREKAEWLAREFGERDKGQIELLVMLTPD